MYGDCLLKYRPRYRDGIWRVSEALEKCYDRTKLAGLDTVDEPLAYYDDLCSRTGTIELLPLRRT